MEFSIIYTADCPRAVSVAPYRPPSNQKRLWQLTEGDNQYEYAHLGGCWAKGKDRKWCAVLSQQQFQDFVDHTNLHAQDVRTMGSLGAPGCGFGWAPAFCFRGDDDDAMLDAYVTPLASAAEMARFLRLTNVEFDADIHVPALLTDDPQQGHLFAEIVDAEAEQVEEAVRRAFLAHWGR